MDITVDEDVAPLLDARDFLTADQSSFSFPVVETVFDWDNFVWNLEGNSMNPFFQGHFDSSTAMDGPGFAP
jgi:hypothetical protein